MNWIGGWRSRVMKSNDTKKQKEFFEKKRLQNRHNLLLPSSASPKKGNVGNMDLLTMFIVNQIALKKEHPRNPRFTHFPTFKRVKSEKSLELPMSPCSPSRLTLTESESHCSDKTLGLNKRKNSLLDEFRFKKLSPLVESNLSDNGASAWLHQIQGSVSSFSSPSPSSSEAFNLQARPSINIFPHATTEAHSTKVQPEELCEYNPWTVSYQTDASQITFADGVLFGSTLNRESTEPPIHSAEIPFSDLEVNHQEEVQHIIGLNGDISENRTVKLHLQTESPYLPTRSLDFNNSNNTDHSIDFYSQQMSGCVDCKPCEVHRIVSEHACESPGTFYQGRGFVTSDDVTNSVPSLKYILPQQEIKKKYGDSYMLHPKDNLPSSHQATPSGISAPTRVMAFNQKVMCKHEHNERERKAHGASKTLRCEEDQFVPSCLQANTQSKKTPRKASPRTQNQAAQTACFLKNASVQCCLLKPAGMSIITKPATSIHHSRTYKALATRRQTRHRSENVDSNQFAPSDIHKMKLMKTSRMMAQRQATHQGPESIIACESLCKSKSQAYMMKHPLPHGPERKEQPSEHMVSRSEGCEGREEGSVNQNPTVNPSCTDEHNNAFTAETGEDKGSVGRENLNEMALHMLNQKNKQ